VRSLWVCADCGSRLLQLLDVGCFFVLKCVYGTLVAQGIHDGKDHIDKANMLEIHKTTHMQALQLSNIQNGFRATGLIPLNPSGVLEKLEIYANSVYHNDDEQTLQTIPRTPKTPHNSAQLDFQVKIIQESMPSRTATALSQLVKGAKLAIH
jgi:hypothetical protein